MNGSSVAQQLVPYSILQDEDKMMALAKNNPQEFLKQLKIPPGLTGDITQALSSIMPVAGMAKVFKAGPTTVEEYVAHLAKTGTTMSPYATSVKSIKTPLGEIFTAADKHPVEEAIQSMTRRGKAAGALDFGFKPAYEGAPHISEALANTLRKPEGVKTVNNLLNKGISIDSITSILKEQSTKAAQAAFGY